MNAIKKEINPWTLKFRNVELEESYQATRISFEDLPLIGKVIILATIMFAVLRRFQLLFDSLYGSQMYDSGGELRLTLLFVISTGLEFVFAYVKTLNILRGSGLVVGSFWNIIDASCFYYPKEPSLTPM